MGLFDKLIVKPKKEHIDVMAEKGILYLPTEGEVIALSEIADGVFSEGVLGKGVGIRPTEEKVFAPANGKISIVADTKHAVGLLTDEGVEVLIHVGMDTVDMNGDGFTPYVKVGDTVAAGDLLLKFSLDKIKAAGHPTTTAFVVTNTDECASVEVTATGKKEKLSPIIKVEK